MRRALRLWAFLLTARGQVCDEADEEALRPHALAHPLPKAVLAAAKRLAGSNCSSSCRGSHFVWIEAAMVLQSRIQSCLPAETERLEEFRRLRERSEPCELEALEREAVRRVDRRMATLLDRMQTLTTAEIAAANRTVREELRGYDLGVKPEIVCVRGVSHFAAHCENNFGHFMKGTLYPVFTEVLFRRLLHPKTQLVFESSNNLCPRFRSQVFFHLFFDQLPRVDKLCRKATHRITLEESIPIFMQEKLNLTVDEDVWKRHLTHCGWRPTLHQIVRWRLGLPSRATPLLVYLRRGISGLSQFHDDVNFDPSRRSLVNDFEVAAALATLSGVGGAEVLITTFDIPWQEQVRTAAQATVMLGLRGSAIYTHEMWMPPGSMAVTVMSPGFCECGLAYCAAANPHRGFLWVLATTAGVNCSLGGSWLDSGGEGAFHPPQHWWPLDRDPSAPFSRHYNHTELLAGLRSVLSVEAKASFTGEASPMNERMATKFATWAAGRGHEAACAGFALQMVDGV